MGNATIRDLSISNIKKKSRPKVRNYSFQSSKRLPADRMTELNGIKVPSMPGSCYHGIICALAQHKDRFCPWEKVIELTERYMRQYGGSEAWERFKNKSKVKSYQQRIKDNTHTLTRTGKDCYGYRLHELGMVIYFFKDGGMLLTGGTLVKKDDGTYNVLFTNGKALQVRYRGTTMTYKEYKKFVEMGFINKCGRILKADAIRDFRSPNHLEDLSETEGSYMQVCITLGDDCTQETADRIEQMGFIVEQAFDNELIGRISKQDLVKLKEDADVKSVEISGD